MASEVKMETTRGIPNNKWKPRYRKYVIRVIVRGDEIVEAKAYSVGSKPNMFGGNFPYFPLSREKQIKVKNALKIIAKKLKL